MARPSGPLAARTWEAVDRLARRVDADLTAQDVRLTMGAEPTFVSRADSEAPEWNHAAVGARKRQLAAALLARLRARFAPGALLLSGQGKWYPGEHAPRWSLGLFWRKDGAPCWNDPGLMASGETGPAPAAEDARRFAEALAGELGLPGTLVLPAYEDPWHVLDEESRLPADVDPHEHDLSSSTERARLATLLRRGIAGPAGYVLPLHAAPRLNAGDRIRWSSSDLPLRRGRLYLVPGDAPIGNRLPLDSLPAAGDPSPPHEPERDPFDVPPPLVDRAALDAAARKLEPAADPAPRAVVRTAVCVEPREGRLHAFLPPLTRLEPYLDLVAAVERAAARLARPVVLEGFDPPPDARLHALRITPDPGVLEVNLQPASSWSELVAHFTVLHEETDALGLAAEKFMRDGRHCGTGGGCHITLGGPSAADSPLLRRPDLLRSLITYWQNHPALSYAFAGLFVGPTSQAPRVDEAREDQLYQLEIAFRQMDARGRAGEGAAVPWIVDRLLRNLLVDVTGNTHRAEFCIDKLYSPDSVRGRLGLLELRAFEMAPCAQFTLLQMLLIRALVARFWREPYRGALIRWGTALHDRFMLPHFLEADLSAVLSELKDAGYPIDPAWFSAFTEFRFPLCGTLECGGAALELRHALEPWPVLGEQVSSGVTSRPVDSSLERLQVRVVGLDTDRYAVTCNGHLLPLHATDRPGERVAGVRFKAWSFSTALHPTIGVHAPLVFDIVDTQALQVIGGCTYHVSDPGGQSHRTRPASAGEAASRRDARFAVHGAGSRRVSLSPEPQHPDAPLTLDLRWLAR